MSEFKRSQWSQTEAANQYVDQADAYIPFRRKMYEVVRSYFHHFQCGDGNRILDLGCGDGILSSIVREKDADASVVLVDGSSTMLDKAREKLNGQVKTYAMTFQQIIREQPNFGQFDFIYSSLAIHHLTGKEKQELYRFCRSALHPGGHLMVVDVVLAPVQRLEAWYLELWQEWIADEAERSGRRNEYDVVPRRYKRLSENKPDPVMVQCEQLQRAGFVDIDTYFKFGIFAVFGGKNPEDRLTDPDDLAWVSSEFFDPGI